MSRNTFTPDTEPARFAGLTQRRIAKGQPVGRIVAAMNTVDGGDAGPGAFTEAEDLQAGRIPANRPLEYWQAVELETVAKVAEARRKGLI